MVLRPFVELICRRFGERLGGRSRAVRKQWDLQVRVEGCGWSVSERYLRAGHPFHAQAWAMGALGLPPPPLPSHVLLHVHASVHASGMGCGLQDHDHTVAEDVAKES